MFFRFIGIWDRKENFKNFGPLDRSKNSIRDLEKAISLTRNCGTTLTGMYSIHAPSHSEFKGVGSVEKSLDKEVKKF